MPLIYVADHGTYSEYRDTRPRYWWEATVYIAHGPGMRRVVESCDLSLGDLRESFRNHPEARYWSRNEFRAHVRTLITEPDEADDIVFCAACREPQWSMSDYVTHLGDICESCADSDRYPMCEGCDERSAYWSSINGCVICDSCRDSAYQYCDDCEEYYDNEDFAEYHNHGRQRDDGCCEAPAQSFSIRNDGAGTLGNDERVTVSLPSGVISEDGLYQIARRLMTIARTMSNTYVHADGVAYYTEDARVADGSASEAEIAAHATRLQGCKMWDVASDVQMGKLGNEWQTRQGNFTKRLSRHAYKAGSSIPADVLSEIGNIARAHSTGADYRIEITRDLNMSAADFFHEGSCWWGSYSESRCALKTNGGFGMRSFTDYGDVSGRAWVMPLRNASGDDAAPRFVPTFDTDGPDAWMVFNGYGQLDGYTPARIMAQMSGMTYRKVGFDCAPMYVNNGGYLVTRESIASQYNNGEHISLNVDQHSSLFRTEGNLTNV